MAELMLLYTTWPDAETAEACGRAAVEAGLAACANILAPMRSIYRWQGVLEVAIETPMLLKTSQGAAARLRDFVLERHPDETPCVIALGTDAARSNSAYLHWARGELS
jgi:periplasmic divalent cation tolerance protein